MSDDALEKLAAKAKLMRELGILEADGIKLGPPVQSPPEGETLEQFNARLNRETERRHQIMFAASGTRPKLKRVK